MDAFLASYVGMSEPAPDDPGLASTKRDDIKSNIFSNVADLVTASRGTVLRCRRVWREDVGA